MPRREGWISFRKRSQGRKILKKWPRMHKKTFKSRQIQNPLSDSREGRKWGKLKKPFENTQEIKHSSNKTNVIAAQTPSKISFLRDNRERSPQPTSVTNNFPSTFINLQRIDLKGTSTAVQSFFFSLKKSPTQFTAIVSKTVYARANITLWHLVETKSPIKVWTLHD